MKEKPIIFTSQMVKAILEGRKSQTRRPLKPQPQLAHDGKWDLYIKGKWVGAIAEKNNSILNVCPYGQLGDYLWVREKFTLCPKDFRPNGIIYFANGKPDITYVMSNEWHSSIHMPRYASRITLEIVNVKVEKLQNITEEDARAEGIIWTEIETAPRSGIFRPYAKEQFEQLWDSIYSKKGMGWTVNPWCWCITFKRIT